MSSDEILENVIVVKHIPKELSKEDCKELFSFFNSISFKYFSNKGSRDNTALVTFSSQEDAYAAVFNLHERKIFNNYLLVKILRKKLIMDNETELSSDKISESKKEKNVDQIPEWIKKLLSFAPILNFNEPVKPKLKYKYPSPNNTILSNIVRALVSNENFYNQTLHLMNKFHFPIPFTTDISFPGNLIVVNTCELISKKNTPINLANTELTEMEISSGNESEIPDEFYTPKLKRRKMFFPKLGNIINKRKQYPFKCRSVEKYAIEELFDTDKTKSENQIKLKSISSLNTEKENTEFLEEEGFGKISEITSMDEISISRDSILENIQENFELTKDITKKIYDSFNNEKKSNGLLIDKPEVMLSMDDIKNNTLSNTQWSSITAFKNYNPGTPSCRLYVKNLAKKVVKNDLIKLYSGFIDWSDTESIESFSITCFTEGRMKGQAFINLPSITVSEKALEITNAFLLYDKPLVVQFAKTPH